MSDDLPMGWVEITLSEIGNWGSGGTPKATNHQYYNGSIPWAKIGDLNDGIVIKTEDAITEEGLLNSSAKIVEEGTLLIAMYGSIGKLGIAGTRLATNQAIAFCNIFENLMLKKFAFYYLRSRREHLLSMGQGGTQQNISQTILKAYPVLLPPLNEQRRIVDKLDRIGDRQRSARNELNHIPKLIARYKQAVLAAACSGKLTEDFRLSNSISLVSLSEVCNSITDGDHQAPPKSETGIPFITISAINDGSLNLKKATRFVPESYFEALSKIRKPEIDDILFTVTGSIGIPVIVDTAEPFVFQRHIAILKVNKNIILAKYLLYVLGSEQIQKQALNVATGTAQLTIPLGGLRNFQIQLPSLEEQKEIVRRVEKMFAKIDKMEEEYQKAVKLCDRLEQATLAKAFRGELVPQDPHDEPASVLLEQVKREKEKGKIKTKK